MTLPDPKPGLVVRYDYLWTHEATASRTHGKTRPACLVAATDPSARPRFVVLLPITHTPPAGDTVGIEIPARVRQVIDLDDAPSWVIVSEHNIDTWPNGGLSPLSGQPDVFGHGFIPPGMMPASRPAFWSWPVQGRAAPFVGDCGAFHRHGRFSVRTFAAAYDTDHKNQNGPYAMDILIATWIKPDPAGPNATAQPLKGV